MAKLKNYLLSDFYMGPLVISQSHIYERAFNGTILRTEYPDI